MNAWRTRCSWHCSIAKQRRRNLFDSVSALDEAQAGPDLKVLRVKIGQQALKIDFKKRAHHGRMVERKAMIDEIRDLPVVQPCTI